MFSRKLSTCLLGVAVAASMYTTGCGAHVGVYDPYHHDYHPVDGEVVVYGNWETETHRDHKELKDRNKNEQKEYWEWRHKSDHK